MARPCTQLERDRFQEIVQRTVGKHTLAWAAHLRRAEPTVRNWREGGAIPHNWAEVLQQIAIDPDWFSLPEDGWKKFISTLPNEVLPPSRREYSELFNTTDVLLALEAAASGSTVIVAASNFQDQAVLNTVKAGVEREMAFCFFIAEDSRLKNRLLRFGANIGASDGLLQIAATTAKHPVLEWCEAIILVTKPFVRVARDCVARIQVNDIHCGFEQLYKPGDQILPDDIAATNGRPLWSGMPTRKIDLALEMLGELSNTAEWTTAKPP